MRKEIVRVFKQVKNMMKHSLFKGSIRLLMNKMILLLKRFKIYPPIKRVIFKNLTTITSKSLDFFSQFINKEDLCFDIGAWEGIVTELFLRLGARVISVEPQKRCVEKLRIYFGKNKNVKIINKAIGEKEGFGEIALTKNKTQASSMSSRFRTESRFANKLDWTKIQPIEITTLDSLIQTYGIPKFCKIDVEGYEEFVIKGLSHPIPYMSFEFMNELLSNVRTCCNLLSDIGKPKYNFTIHFSRKNFVFPNWVTEEILLKKLDSLDESASGDIYVKFNLK